MSLTLSYDDDNMFRYMGKDGHWHAFTSNTTFSAGTRDVIIQSAASGPVYVSLAGDAIAYGGNFGAYAKLSRSGDSVTIPGVEFASGSFKLTASTLVSDDPRVNVTWSSSGSKSTPVTLTWDGTAWSSNPRFAADGCTVVVDGTQQVAITVNDSSSRSSDMSALTQPSSDGANYGFLENESTSSSDPVFTHSGSRGTTSYTVNIFSVLKTNTVGVG